MFPDCTNSLAATVRLLCGAALTLAVVLLTPGSALSLNNPGSTSNPSSAELDVSLTVPTMYRISGVGDLAFGSYSGSGSLTLNDDVCVWTNAASGSYRVTAKGDGTDFAFVVKKQGDTSKTIPYSVLWNDESGTTGAISLSANVTSTNQTGANSQSISCSSGSNATGNFKVTLSQSDLLKAVSGSYSGVLTLVISAPS